MCLGCEIARKSVEICVFCPPVGMACTDGSSEEASRCVGMPRFVQQVVVVVVVAARMLYFSSVPERRDFVMICIYLMVSSY